MKKKILFGSAICVIALMSFINIQRLQGSYHTKVCLENIFAAANAEDETPTVSCPRGGTECVRVVTNAGTLVYYKS